MRTQDFWRRLRDAIRRDSSLQENLWFAACGVLTLVGMYLAKTL